MLNSYALYFFLGVSLLCVLVSCEIKFNLFLALMICFQLVLLFGDLYSTSPKMMHYTYNYFISMCIVFCAVNYIRDDKDIMFIFKGVMVGGFVLNLYILSIYGAGFIDAIMSQTRVGEVAGNANDVGLKSCFSAIFQRFLQNLAHKDINLLLRIQTERVNWLKLFQFLLRTHDQGA